MQKSQPPKEKRIVVLSNAFREDIRYWAENDRKSLLKVLDLMEAVAREPFSGMGKPEPLRHKGAGTWSRRISKEHRLLYRVYDERIEFLQARYHH